MFKNRTEPKVVSCKTRLSKFVASLLEPLIQTYYISLVVLGWNYTKLGTVVEFVVRISNKSTKKVNVNCLNP